MISIIIPVFNGSQFIEDNFNSLIKQSSQSFEVIYVDDGSFDDSKIKIENLIGLYPNFKLVSISNSGAMIARKVGLQFATYDYLTFLDVDDVVDEDFILKFSNVLLVNDFEIIGSNFKVLKCGKLNLLKILKPDIYSNIEFIKNLCVNGGWELCGKVYKKSLFDNVVYPSKVTIGEDALIFFQLVSFSKKILILDDYLYTYVFHQSSASNVKDLDKCKDGIRAVINIKKNLVKNVNIEVSYLDTLTLLFYSNSLRRGLLKRNDELFGEVLSSFNFEALRNLSFKKCIIVCCGILLSSVNF